MKERNVAKRPEIDVSRRQLLKGSAAAVCAAGAGAGEALASSSEAVASRLQPRFRRVYLEK